MENQVLNPTETSVSAVMPLNEEPLKKTRKGRKSQFHLRLNFPAVPVRGLWDQASEEEKVQARKIAVTMLEAWTGMKTKSEAARALEMKPLRFWQMSHQAMAGMMAGCLTQPRVRSKLERNDMGMTDKELIASLRKQVKDLTLQVQMQKQLIETMKSMPGIEERLEQSLKEGVGAKSKEGLHAGVQKKSGKAASQVAKRSSEDHG